MIISSIIGRLWGEPEDRMTSTGKSLITLTLSYQDRSKKYQYVRLCLWGDKFNKVVPFLKNGTTVFVQGTLSVESYLSRTKGETVVSMTLHVDSLQIIFQPFVPNVNKNTEQENKEEVAHFAHEEPATPPQTVSQSQYNQSSLYDSSHDSSSVKGDWDFD